MYATFISQLYVNVCTVLQRKKTVVKLINMTLAHGYVLGSSARTFLKVIYLAGAKRCLLRVTVECNVNLYTTVEPLYSGHAL